MDHDVIVEPWLDRCKSFRENILQAPDLQSVARASWAIFTQIRQLARDMLQAKITLEAQQLTRADVIPCCPEAGMTDVHTRTVRPQTWLGESTIPVRTFQCHGCGATCRPDDTALGVPEVGALTDDVRWVYAPLAAELPHRGANPLFAPCTGVRLSSQGAQGLINSTAEALRPWQAEREPQEAEAVGHGVAAAANVAALRVEIAMAGVTAHLDGRWQPPKVATIQVRRLAAPAEEPTLGAGLTRRDVSVLGPAEDLAVRLKQALHEAGWEHLPLGEILGDGAPWI